MAFEPIHSFREGGDPAGAYDRDREIGMGTPLKDDSLTPLSTPGEKHEPMLGIGPGTPWKDDGDEAAPETHAEPQAQEQSRPQAPREEQPHPAAETAALQEDKAFDGEEEFQNEFAQVYEQSLEKELEPGEIIEGRIIRIDTDEVVVDVGYKSEGIIAKEEFINARGEFTAHVGDGVRVLVQRRENKEGLMVLSKRQVDKRLGWERVRAALANNGTVEGQIAAKTKGGYLVDLDGLQAFLPGSQLDLHAVSNPDAYLGQRFAFKVIKLNKDRGNIVVSRRNLLIDERNQKRSQVLSQIAPGRLVHGVVKTIAKFGAFIDLGGVDGLLRVEDMSWSRANNPRQFVKQGEEIEALVLSVNEETGKVALGLKQKSQDPWANLESKYPAGSLVEGEVVSMTDFGTFLRLEEGVEGLLPISEMSWTKRIRHPQDVLKAGDRVRVKVLSVDQAAKKISLGLKQTEPEPFSLFIESHKAGDVVPGEVKSLTSYGAFVEVAEGVSGLLHISDLSWDAGVKQPADVLKRGEQVNVKILEIQPEKKKISLGLKQLGQDPWQSASSRYPVGAVVKVKVLRNTKIGSFVQLEPGVEGLIHISQIEKPKGAAEPVMPAVGNTLEAKVVKVNPAEHKIGLSVRELVQDQEQAEVQKYLSPSNRHGVSLGELAGVDLEALKRKVSSSGGE